MISSPNVTPFPLGCKQTKKSTGEKGTQCKDVTIRNKFTHCKRNHLLYDKHTNNATSLHLVGIKEKGQH